MRPAIRSLRALSAEFWAIEPSWIPVIAAIAQRNSSADEVEAAREWTKRDYLAMAGGGAQKLAGTYRGFVINRVGILPITGPIFPRANLLTELSGATSVAMLQNDHRLMMESKDVSSIQQLIDSPGGSVSGIADFAARVASGSQRKKTHAFVSGSAASAAYWIASAANFISIDRTGIVGSIGVLAVVPKQVAPGEDGIVSIEIVSSNAPNKRVDPQAEEGVSIIRESLDAIERVFVGDVARGRGVPVSKVLSDFGRGGILIGSAAVAAGMVDKVENQTSAFNGLRAAPILSPNHRAMTLDQRNRQRVEELRPGRQDQQKVNMQRLAALRARR